MQKPLRPDVHHHAVKFYPTDESLFAAVGGFLGQGLADHQPTILIVTPAHRDGILAELESQSIDIKQAIRTGGLLIHDANEMLDRFMIGDIPDPDAFETHVGGLIVETLSRYSERVAARAYGEMVDILWREERRDAAIMLEMLWNTLVSRYGFALLCGYSMGHFYKEIDLLERVCEQHTHVMPPDPPVPSTHIH